VIDFCAQTTSMLRNNFFQVGRILRAQITRINYQFASGAWLWPAVYLWYALNARELRANRAGTDTLLLIWLAITCGSLSSGAARAEAIARHFNIPGQSLNNALIQFAAETQLKLIFSADMLRGVVSPNLSGNMSIELALQCLLQNSGFNYRFIDADTVTLEPATVSSKHPTPSPVTLQALTVFGSQPKQVDPTSWAGKIEELPGSYAVSRIGSATRTDTPPKQIPQSVQAIKRELLDDQQNITVSETLSNVSGVVPRNVLYTPVMEGTLIRGFRSEQLLDGFTQYYNPGDRESTINIQRIEVLKGSNAVLYSGGSGSPVGGVINLLSKLPQAKAFGEAGVKIGSNSFYQPFLDVNQPLTDNIRLRFSGEYTNARRNIDVIETQRFNINPVLVFTDNDKTRLTIQGKLSRWQQPEYQGLPATGSVAGSFRTGRNVFLGPGDLPDSRSESAAVWASLEHRIDRTWQWSLKARLARSEFDEKIQTLFGADGFVADRPLLAGANWGLVNAELFQEQQERSVLGNLLAKFQLGPSENQLLIGADHSELNDAGFVDGDFGLSGLGAGIVDLRSPSFGGAYQTPGPGVNNQFIQNITYGAYAQWQSTLYERLHLLNGLRLSDVAIDFNNTRTGLRALTDTLKWLPRAGAVLDLNSEISWFVSYSEGMRGQPFVNFVDTPLPELFRHLETGFKFDVAEQLSGQLALYQIDRSQVAVTDNSDVLRRSEAAGRQRSRGIEADLLWQPLEGLNLLANYAHTDARFVDDKAGVAIGNRLALVPEDSGRIWANYRLPPGGFGGVSLGFGVYLRTGAYLSNNNDFKTAGYHSFDAALAYETARFKWAATVKNLSDSDYFQPYGYFDGRVAAAQGRAAYLTFSMRY
jgi:iron complex outermembrane receptor protein